MTLTNPKPRKESLTAGCCGGAHKASGMDFMVLMVTDSSEDLLAVLGAEGPISGSANEVSSPIDIRRLKFQGEAGGLRSAGLSPLICLLTLLASSLMSWR